MSDERKGTLYSARSAVLFGTALLLVSNSYASITGTDSQSITGTDSQSITGTDSQSITGTDSQSITGTDSQSITGTDSQSITGTDSQSITGTDSQSITGTDLLVVGTVDFADNGFLSVLGQSVFGEEGEFDGISIGDTVAIYGHIDGDFGGIADSTVMPMPGGNGRSLLTGIVDSVNPSLGRAIVGGVSVDYTATLSNGATPRVGQQLSVTGRVYGRRGLVTD